VVVVGVVVVVAVGVAVSCLSPASSQGAAVQSQFCQHINKNIVGSDSKR
jgi:hypothetical protein